MNDQPTEPHEPELSVDAVLRIERIILLALVMGVVTFGVIAGVMVFGQQQANAQPVANAQLPNGLPLISLIAVGFACVILVLQAVVPNMMVSVRRKPIALQFHISRADLLPLHQIRLIVGLALCEGAAFFNLVACIVEKQWWSIPIAGFLVIVMLAKFPTYHGIEEWTERQFELVERDRETMA
ncbi:MAG TPA: hypothetical protein VHB77_15495 [Planctomycetaceae bacterium]|nr:hypothetical protein [Planctomycetaceae bacterium]